MERRSVTAIALPVGLLLLTAIPIVMSGFRLFQIPAGTLPADAAYFKSVPFPHFIHALTGMTFGLLGPLQFGRVLAGRFGWLHRVAGRVFVLAGAGLSVSSLRLLWEFPGHSTWLLDAARLVTGLALGAALFVAMAAIRRQDFARHKAWMIRAYAIGMGAATIALIMFPIYIATGAPLTGLGADLAFVGSWVINIAIGEWVIRRKSRSRRQIPA